MKHLWMNRLSTIFGLCSLGILLVAIALLASGNKTNRDEILKSRAANLQGRSQVLDAISEVKAVCSR